MDGARICRGRGAVAMLATRGEARPGVLFLDVRAQGRGERTSHRGGEGLMLVERHRLIIRVRE